MRWDLVVIALGAVAIAILMIYSLMNISSSCSREEEKKEIGEILRRDGKEHD